jgi:hypothetical protein
MLAGQEDYKLDFYMLGTTEKVQCVRQNGELQFPHTEKV